MLRKGVHAAEELVMKTWTHCGRVYEVDKARTCPFCTKFKLIPWHDPLGSQPVEVSNPVFLVKRTNRQTGAQFWGCPKFPKCNWTESIPDKRGTCMFYPGGDPDETDEEDFRDGCPNC